MAMSYKKKVEFESNLKASLEMSKALREAEADENLVHSYEVLRALSTCFDLIADITDTAVENINEDPKWYLRETYVKDVLNRIFKLATSVNDSLDVEINNLSDTVWKSIKNKTAFNKFMESVINKDED